MTKKIFKGICFVAAIVLIFSVIVTLVISYAYFGSQIEDELENELIYISHALNTSGNAFLDQLPADDDTRITLIDIDGRVVFDSRVEDISALDNHLEREEIAEALTGEIGKSTRQSSTMSEVTVNLAKRLNDGRIVRVSAAKVHWLALFLNMLTPVLVILIIAVIFAIFLAMQLSRRIVKPLNTIDLDNLDEGEIYDELRPMISRIKNQNELIRRQMLKLERRRTEFNTITDNMHEGMIIIDNRAEILSYNVSALELLDATPAEKHRSVLALNSSEGFRRAISSALMGMRKESIITSESKYTRIIATPVKNKETIAGVVILILDETEKVKNERIRREFTSNVSHELKTPLTSISGFAELMKSGMVSPEDTLHFSENIYNEAQRLIILVNDIIKLSKLDERAGMSDVVEFDVSRLVNEVCERFMLVAAKKEITLETDVEQGVIVEGNKNIIDEVIYNLCDNAIKYNREKGSVKVSLISSDDMVTISVSDTGIGIPEELHERVFERFFRVDKSHSKEIGGTGLGLSIVKRGVLYHKGELSIHSESGKGSTISIKLNRKFIRED